MIMMHCKKKRKISREVKLTSEHRRDFCSELVDRTHGYASVLVLHAIHQLFHLKKKAKQTLNGKSRTAAAR